MPEANSAVNRFVESHRSPDRAEFESFSRRAPDCHRPSGGYSARLRRCSRVFTSANSLGRPNSERGYVRSDKPVRALWRAFEPTRPHQKFCRPSCRRAAFTGREQQPPTDDRPARAVPHSFRIAELSNPVHVREGWVERTADVCVDSRAVHVLRPRVVGRGEHGIVEGFGRDPDPHVS